MEKGSQLGVVDEMQIPTAAHIPGVNERPQSKLLEEIAAQALTPTCDATAHGNVAWLYGLRLLRNGYYWEAHEVLEAVWMNAEPNSRERHLVQGVIHLANAALKDRMDRPGAVRRLSNLSRESFDRAFPASRQESLMGLSGDALEAAATKIASGAHDFRHISFKTNLCNIFHCF